MATTGIFFLGITPDAIYKVRLPVTRFTGIPFNNFSISMARRTIAFDKALDAFEAVPIKMDSWITHDVPYWLLYTPDAGWEI
jgi:hypothetical protein